MGFSPFAEWAAINTKLAIQGIFFETFQGIFFETFHFRPQIL